jgi:hypothetical protein
MVDLYHFISIPWYELNSTYDTRTSNFLHDLRIRYKPNKKLAS